MPVLSSGQLISYLPAIYEEDEFLGQFLLAFEKILLGINKDELQDKSKYESKGLEETIAIITTFFDPTGNESEALEKRQRTPKEFLSWLASWVALSLRDDWEEEAQRRFISRIVPLYKQRGTKAGMLEMLKTYTGIYVEVEDELSDAIQIGVVSTVGVDTRISEGLPHFFKVKIILENLDDLKLERKRQIAQAIIEQEKPAHTYYRLDVEVPSTIQVGVAKRATIGVNTFLGKIPQESSSQQ